ncbi:MAG: DUF4294 domain-containing protein [Bacteroidetes bacterium]|nr:MAG: DUF4294 domain-containing protein [Bacteroidota bacterium]
MINKHYILSLFLLLIFTLSTKAQEEVKEKKKHFLEVVIINNDTLPHINLREIIVLPPRKFTSRAQRRRYWRLVYNIKKAYPYAKIASRELMKLNDTLLTIKSKRQQKLCIKQAQNKMLNKYKNQLKKLTITQGRILIKLVDRETGNTSYSIIKDYRGSFSAFFWQSIARFFGENLKENYNPEEEDRLIEDIVTRIENGQL